jgi:hypothetical protein
MSPRTKSPFGLPRPRAGTTRTRRRSVAIAITDWVRRSQGPRTRARPSRFPAISDAILAGLNEIFRNLNITPIRLMGLAIAFFRRRGTGSRKGGHTNAWMFGSWEKHRGSGAGNPRIGGGDSREQVRGPGEYIPANDGPGPRPSGNEPGGTRSGGQGGRSQRSRASRVCSEHPHGARAREPS